MVARKTSAFSTDDSDPRLADLAIALKRAVLVGLRVAMPATVIVPKPKTSGDVNRVDVLPGWTFTRRDEHDREVETPMQPILGVPVGFFALGGFKMTVSPNPGDEGMLLTFDRKLDSWLASGGQRDPEFNTLHNLGDSLFLPVMTSSLKAVEMGIGKLQIGIENDAMFEIDRITGTVKVKASPIIPLAEIVLDGPVKVGGPTAAQAMVLGETLVAVLSALTVGTAMGPSTIPLNVATFPTVKSVRHKIDI